jgi:hypothetical protein
MHDHQVISAFWQWFVAHEGQIRILQRPCEPFWDVVLAELRRIHVGLWYELSADLAQREFIVTTHGCTELFALADAVIAAAPRLSGWHF